MPTTNPWWRNFGNCWFKSTRQTLLLQNNPQQSPKNIEFLKSVQAIFIYPILSKR
ncbi:hypothetical protein AO372_1062 [Moraxella catarrhalis]|uniref:Uncharacterized protein n=1 Tax=Moraxella catarrhalis TaxID=480 RepID=A0A198WYW1_MORCA|nr:hypothetical protein MCR_1617 [Moraxella catarrhalis BBH18]AZQ87396.1 hypothetical protein EJK52_1674 [Moraxella catarrhalis]AZQ91876.1 hypothetical protein EJK51_1674 [Moraxella catarrhalis]AZQ92485.1 hypothetical protein EJK53_1946 [Moraxella catarrhalis]AZQ95640.1 hypothetical protein EJK48_1782 [Moraxella catarrhalis]